VWCLASRTFMACLGTIAVFVMTGAAVSECYPYPSCCIHLRIRSWSPCRQGYKQSERSSPVLSLDMAPWCPGYGFVCGVFVLHDVAILVSLYLFVSIVSPCIYCISLYLLYLLSLHHITHNRTSGMVGCACSQGERDLETLRL
jgi:hypothetical protein